MSEVDVLKKILTDDWTVLASKGYVAEGFITVDRHEGDDGRWTRNIEVITRAPSGQHYRWEYERGLTERDESTGPAEYGDPEIVAVQAQEKTVVVVEWVASAA